MALKKDRKLGVSQIKGRYDLPLTQNVGSSFLIILVGLMTFLALITLSAGFVLNGVTERWSSGLENALTIEIPASTRENSIRSSDELSRLSQNVSDILAKSPAVQSFEVQSEEQISSLLAPWLGEGLDLDSVPLPALISVELKANDQVLFDALRSQINTVASDIRLDTHEEWLGDIIRMALSLKIAALFITIVIGFTTITAIAGGVRSRMAEHKDDIELLHLIGAKDNYIMKQFQRHAGVLTFKGSLAGMIGGLSILGLITLLARKSSQAIVIPDFSLTMIQMIVLLCLPLIICIIGALTARITVLRVLSSMP